MSVRFAGDSQSGVALCRDELISAAEKLIKSGESKVDKINGLRRILDEISQCDHKMLWGQDKSIDEIKAILADLEKEVGYIGPKIKPDIQVAKTTDWESKKETGKWNIEDLERYVSATGDVKMMKLLEKYREMADMGDNLVEKYKRKRDIRYLKMLNEIKEYCRSKTFYEVEIFNKDNGIVI
jgi:hypothetical protein